MKRLTNSGKPSEEMTLFELSEVAGSIELVRITKSFAHPECVAVKIKDVIDILRNSNYVREEDKLELLQLMLDKSLDIGVI